MFGAVVRAVIAGGDDRLVMVERPPPVPRPDEVLIEVVAAGVNRADILQRRGLYDPPPGASEVLGLECSGRVAAYGSEVTGLSVGDEVCALLSGGGYADYVVVPAGQVAPLPRGMSMIAAGGLVEAAATVWSNLFDVGRLQPGETLLVHGGSSGIGTTAIQVARAYGARVIATAGTTEKLEACRALGADLAINYREVDFADELARLGLQVDVILDIMGASYLTQNVRSLATGGRLVVIGLQGGMSAELELDQLLIRRASVLASSLRARPAAQKKAILLSTVEHIWPLVERGEVTPVVHRELPLEEAAEAHRLLEESGHIGKIVLRVGRS